MDEVLQRDENHVTVLAGITDDSNQNITMLRVDPVTKRLLVSGELASSTLFTQTSIRTIFNSSSEFTLTKTGVGSLTIPANTISVGESIRLRAKGYMSIAGAAVNASIRFNINGTTYLSALTQSIASLSGTRLWEVDVVLTCTAVGVSGSLIGQGGFTYSPTATTVARFDMVNTAEVTVDTTSTMVIDLTFQWGTANTLNTISCTNLNLTTE